MSLYNQFYYNHQELMKSQKKMPMTAYEKIMILQFCEEIQMIWLGRIIRLETEVC